MEALPAILESMRLSLLAITALVGFGLVVSTLMLYRQSGMLRDHSRMLRDISKQVADSEAIVRATYALAAKAAAALENVSRLVVHPGGRTS